MFLNEKVMGVKMIKIMKSCEIIEEYQEYYDDIAEIGGITEKYDGEFKETIFKKWISIKEALIILYNLQDGNYYHDKPINKYIDELKND